MIKYNNRTKKIRVGNDFICFWYIRRSSRPEDIINATDIVLTATNGDRVIPLEFSVINTDTLKIEVKTEWANELGDYVFTVSYVLTDPSFSDDMRANKINKRAFKIVPKSEQANTYLELHLTSEVLTGFKGDPFEYDDFTQEQLDAIQQPILDFVVLAENAEANREDKEADRRRYENSRKLSESDRVTKELERLEAESTRVIQESTRETAEGIRKDNEQDRVTAEDLRLLAEPLRISQENDRKSNENIRITSEENRIEAEDDRIANENQRVIDEGKREQLYDNTVILKGEVETLKTETETAKDNAITATNQINTVVIPNAELATQNAIDVKTDYETVVKPDMIAKANYAEAQGDYAKEKGDLADTARLAIQDDLELKANHGYESNPKTLKEVEDNVNSLSPQIGINLAEDKKYDGYISRNGTITPSSGWYNTGFINVVKGKLEFIGTLNNPAYIALYDINKKLTRSIRSTNISSGDIIDIEGNESYINVSYTSRPVLKYIEIDDRALIDSNILNSHYKTIKSLLPVIGEELVSTNYADLDGGYINTNGVAQTSEGWFNTGYIRIVPGKIEFASFVNHKTIAFYDISKNFISAYTSTGTEVHEVVVPPKTRYFRASSTKDYSCSVKQIEIDDIDIVDAKDISNIENTSDLDKPISNAQRVEFDKKADKSNLDYIIQLNTDLVNGAKFEGLVTPNGEIEIVSGWYNTGYIRVEAGTIEYTGTIRDSARIAFYDRNKRVIKSEEGKSTSFSTYEYDVPEGTVYVRASFSGSCVIKQLSFAHSDSYLSQFEATKIAKDIPTVGLNIVKERFDGRLGSYGNVILEAGWFHTGLIPVVEGVINFKGHISSQSYTHFYDVEKNIIKSFNGDSGSTVSVDIDVEVPENAYYINSSTAYNLPSLVYKEVATIQPVRVQEAVKIHNLLREKSDGGLDTPLKLSLLDIGSFIRAGGEILQGDFLSDSKVLSIPYKFNSDIYLEAEVQFGTCPHSKDGSETIMKFISEIGQDAFEIRLESEKNTSVEGAGYQKYTSYLRGQLGWGNHAARAESFSDNLFHFMGRDALSIQFIGDTSLTANQNLAIELTDNDFVIYRGSDIVKSYDVSLFTTVRDLYDALQDDIDSGVLENYKLKSFNSYDSPISDLVKISKTNITQERRIYVEEEREVLEETFFDNNPVGLPLRDKSWHKIQMVYYSETGIAHLILDDVVFDFWLPPIIKPSGARLEGKLIIGGEQNGDNLFKGEIRNLTLASTPSELYKRHNHLIFMGHGVTVADKENPELGLTTSTARLGRIFDYALSKGYKLVTIQELIGYMYEGKEIPLKTLSVVYDDYQFPIYTNREIRSFVEYYGHKPVLALIFGRDYTETELNAIRGMEALGWGYVCHSATHPSMGYMSYAQLVSEVDKVNTQMEKYGLNSNTWVYSYGSQSYYSRKYLMYQGYKMTIGVGARSTKIAKGSNAYSNSRTDIGDGNSFDSIKEVLI